jgi:hypothetical protein
MLKMCREMGFKIKTDADDRALCDVTLMVNAFRSAVLTRTVMPCPNVLPTDGHF